MVLYLIENRAVRFVFKMVLSLVFVLDFGYIQSQGHLNDFSYQFGKPISDPLVEIEADLPANRELSLQEDKEISYIKDTRIHLEINFSKLDSSLYQEYEYTFRPANVLFNYTLGNTDPGKSLIFELWSGENKIGIAKFKIVGNSPKQNQVSVPFKYFNRSEPERLIVYIQ